ncbi:MAG: glucose-phosphate cytidylyltransferase RfbF [Herbinix sp.]|nr:glucose-phosphate cytidylyltransferase RfbF [Herbinix sp.]
MKVVILAGGFGTRISEESHLKPKPMIEIGGKPLLWHIMKIYSHYNFNEFIICSGYKQHVIKEWFAHYFIHNSDITFDLTEGNKMFVHSQFSEPWRVTVVDTGLSTMTGGRIKRVRDYIGEEPFFLTYGDGLADVNISDMLEFHKKHGKIATLTAVQPEGRFGIMDIQGNQVMSFREKIQADNGWVNGGFMILNPEVIDYIEGDKTMFEEEPLEALAADGELICYKHGGFWQCMDSIRDKERLETLWTTGDAPWKVWGKYTKVVNLAMGR